MTTSFEPVVGRYLSLDLLGRRHRLYVEEAGSGIPLLCLHTAGSDGRQYRALMNDSDILSRFRVIAFDMPWHGKSSPPPGWRDQGDYKLTAPDFVSIIMDVVDALELERPVVMGCSMSGRVVLYLALLHAQRFRAAIGLQAGDKIEPYYDISWLHRPDISNELPAGIVSGLIAPQSDDNNRWETLWHYMQGGPGVHKGDLHFYTVDGDIGHRIAEIDTSQCPVFLLTGEYDYSCSPDDTQALASRIAGAEFTVMKEMGHFPMSENPVLFLQYLKPILARIT